MNTEEVRSVSRIQLAEQLAIFAHTGQVDRAGKPYYKHPLAVASRVTGENEKIVALLHDVVEDTSIDNDTIRNIFGDDVADALALLTHDDQVPYMDYVRALSVNPISRAVKLADLSHNMDLSRLPEVTEKDLKRLEKYQEAKRILEAAK